MTEYFSLPLQFLPIFLYAETHYKFRYLFSFLRKREPEIIADAPHRLDPNKPLPILALIKDAHLFPIELKSIRLIIRANGKKIRDEYLHTSKTSINQKIWWQIYEVSIENIFGFIEYDIVFTINNGKKEKVYFNDNYRTSSHSPLKTFVSESPLPKFENLYFGECHSHSLYTDDQVEFGAPLAVSQKLCKSFGLSFFCATDHSYDLDDRLDNYLFNDTELPKWNLLQKEADELNSTISDFAIIRGEEVTCRNSNNKNVHLLLLGNRKYFYGSGDGAERWLKTYSENSIADVLNNVESDTLAFSAHPYEPVSFLQRLLLNRGMWNREDFNCPHLSGIQFANGQLSAGFLKGRSQWVKSLIQGKKVLIIAGNDAHGNFNRFRQIGVPFLKIREMGHQLFGKMRTGVFLNLLSEKSILNAIRSGAAIVTDGPVVNMVLRENKNIDGIKHAVTLDVQSSAEFGSIESATVFYCQIGSGEEKFISRKPENHYFDRYEFYIENNQVSYIRAEVWTSSADSYDKQPHFCFTNPIWLNTR